MPVVDHASLAIASGCAYLVQTSIYPPFSGILIRSGKPQRTRDTDPDRVESSTLNKHLPYALSESA